MPLLAARLLAAATERHRKRVDGIDPAAMMLLVGFEWPGNVRELENEIERAVALVRGGKAIGVGELSAKLADRRAEARPETASPDAVIDPTAAGTELRSARATVEARYIRDALVRHGGNVTGAARALGMSRVTLYKKMRDLGLSHAPKKS